MLALATVMAAAGAPGPAGELAPRTGVGMEDRTACQVTRRLIFEGKLAAAKASEVSTSYLR